MPVVNTITKRNGSSWDIEDAAALHKSGGTMTGAINMGNHKITNVADGVNDSDAMAFGQYHGEVFGQFGDIVAEEYDSTKEYAVGEVVIYTDKLYKCITATAEGGEEWDSTHWEQTLIAPYLKKVQTDVDNMWTAIGRNQSWDEIQRIVAAGYGPAAFPVGTQLSCNHSEFGTIVWDVVGHDVLKKAGDEQAHTMALMTNKVITGATAGTNVRLETYLPWLYFPDGLPSGEYYVSFSQGGTLHKLVFTIPSEYPIPERGMMRSRYTTSHMLFDEVPEVSYMFTYDHVRFGGEITLTEQGDVGDAVDLGQCFSTTGGISTFTVIGTEYRAIRLPTTWSRSGHNLYAASSMRKYLNSADEVIVFNQYDDLDFAAEWLSNRSGFLYGFNTDFLNVLTPFTVFCKTNNVFEIGDLDESFGLGSGELYQLSDMMALASYNEVSAVEGTQDAPAARLQYYEGATDTTRMKLGYMDGLPAPWILRSPIYTYSTHRRIVTASGSITSAASDVGLNISTTKSFAPMCCIG